MKFAFRCKNCGHLETSGQAAESPHPTACSVCCFGVSFHPVTGIRTVNASNWDVLANLKPFELAKLGLKPDQVEAHVQWPTTKRTPQNLSVSADETFVSKDRG